MQEPQQLMMKRFKTIILALLCIIAITGCEQSKPCIDADDFGFPKIKLKGTGIDVEGTDENQVSKWKDSELVIDGTQIIFDVYGRWFPWLEGNAQIVRDPCFYETGIVYPYNIGSFDNSGIKVNKYSQPCWLTKGMGVYGLTVKTDASGDPNLSVTWNFTPVSDPNRNIVSREFPSNANSFHMGDPGTADLYPTRTFDLDSDPGGGAFKQGIRVGTYDMLGKTSGPNKTEIGDRLYFKILDTFYADNGGSVVVKIRSGARSPYPGVFEKLINAVSDIILGSAEIIFRQLLDPSRSDIPRAIHALLILYIALYGLYYVMGMVSPDTTQGVFLTKIIKFGVVAALLSSTSYEFFYDYLLVLFNEGMKETINIISGPFLSGSAHATDRMTFFDDVFKKLFSEETNIKIASLLWFPNPTNKWVAELNPKGLFYIPVLYIFIAFFAVALLKALLVYLMTLIALGMLIALAPIIIPFILFSRTKEMYEGWLKALIGTAIQPVILFGFLTLMYVILLESLYKTLGYRVCWNTWWSGSLFGEGSIIDIIDADSSDNDLKAWMPNIREKWDAILVPPFFYSTYSVGGCGIGETTNVGPGGGDVFLDIDCSKIGEHCRLVDYPALVPENADRCASAVSELNDPNDELQIARAQSGTVTSFEDIFFFGVTIFLMFLFSDKVPQLARDIAGLTHGAALESAAGGLWSNVKSIGSNPLGIRSMAKSALGINRLTEKFRNWQDKVGGAYDQGKARLEKGVKRKAMQATGTYGAYKKLSGLRKEGEKTFQGIQDKIGSKLEKVDKHIKPSTPIKLPLKVADKLAVKGIEKVTGKNIGTLDPRDLALKGVEGIGTGVGKLYGKAVYGTPKKEEKARKLLAGSTGEITNRESLEKKADTLSKKLEKVDRTKDPDKFEKLDKELKGTQQQLDSINEEARKKEQMTREVEDRERTMQVMTQNALTSQQSRLERAEKDIQDAYTVAQDVLKAEHEARTTQENLDRVSQQITQTALDKQKTLDTNPGDTDSILDANKKIRELEKQKESLQKELEEKQQKVDALFKEEAQQREEHVAKVERERKATQEKLDTLSQKIDQTTDTRELRKLNEQKTQLQETLTQQQETLQSLSEHKSAILEAKEKLYAASMEKQEAESTIGELTGKGRGSRDTGSVLSPQDKAALDSFVTESSLGRDKDLDKKKPQNQLSDYEEEVRKRLNEEIKGSGMFTKGGEDLEAKAKAEREKQMKKLEAAQAAALLKGRIDALKSKGEQLDSGGKAELDRLTRELENIRKDLNS